MDSEAVQQKLEAAYARQGQSVQLEDLQLLTGGSASQTWRFTAVDKGKSSAYILRIAHQGDPFVLGLDKRTEAKIQNLAAQAGVKAAPVHLTLHPDDGLGEGYVMPFFQGESIPQRILRKDDYTDLHEAICRQCGGELARLHTIDPANADFLPMFDAGKQLNVLNRYYRDIGQIVPIFDYAFRWLSQHQPENDNPAIVHGDFRNGNLLVNGTGLSCILDWELCHMGDPMEDLGWLCVPSWRFGNLNRPVGGLGQREDLFAAYEKAGGRSVDPDLVTYWEIFGVLKWGIICLYQTDVHMRGVERSVNRAAIGRRVSETELDLLAYLMEGR